MAGELLYLVFFLLSTSLLLSLSITLSSCEETRVRLRDLGLGPGALGKWPLTLMRADPE